MVDLEDKELIILVDHLRETLSVEEIKDFEAEYHQTLDYVVQHHYQPVVLKKYFEDYILRKLTGQTK